MVRIDKSSQPVPPILAPGGKGHALTESMKADFDAGVCSFEFSSKIYGHASVKETLKNVQHGKCCFCESKVGHISHGDVEHFRPKAGYQIDENGSLTQPGYFWLVYDFSNLFFACQICNQVYKRNFFPLADETCRVKSHTDNLLLEANLIIHPELDTPESHLEFIREIARPRDGSIKGEMTILRTGLNRKELADERLDYLMICDKLADVARDFGNPQAATARHFFIDKSQPNHLYSRMVRDNFADLCRP